MARRTSMIFGVALVLAAATLLLQTRTLTTAVAPLLSGSGLAASTPALLHNDHQIGVIATPHKSGHVLTATDNTAGDRPPPWWRPRTCLRGTQLDDPRIVAKCADQRRRNASFRHGSIQDIAPSFCDALLARGDSAPCGQWSHGRYSPTVATDAGTPPVSSARTCSPDTHEFRFDGPGGFETLRVAAADGGACPLVDVSDPAAARAILRRVFAQGGILFTGDSMMRQIFLRLIAVLRGQHDQLGDHYFHFDAIYVALRSGEDALMPLYGNAVDGAAKVSADGSGPSIAGVMRRFFPGYSGLKKAGRSSEHADEVAAVDFAMLFQWDTKPSQHRTDFARMRPALHVAAFMYWWQNKDPITDLDGYTNRVSSEYAADGAGGSSTRRRQYVWVTTPWTAPKLFGGVETPIREARNAKALAWLETLPQAAVVDFAKIAEAKRMPKTRDGIHYMCIWTPKLPDRANGMKDNGQLCRDPMNLGVVAVLLTKVAAVF